MISGSMLLNDTLYLPSLSREGRWRLPLPKETRMQIGKYEVESVAANRFRVSSPIESWEDRVNEILLFTVGTLVSQYPQAHVDRVHTQPPHIAAFALANYKKWAPIK
jgi:hypothetical protein